MSAIEKICELSGEYPGWLMYAMKKNHIQIDKKFRHLFKGADAELVVTGIELLHGHMDCDGGYTYTLVNEWEILDDFENNPFYYMAYHRKWEKQRPLFRYEYELRVSNPELQGRVDGVYSNCCFNMNTTKRKLRRMVGPGLKMRSEVRSRKKVVKDWAKEVVAYNIEQAALSAKEV